MTQDEVQRFALVVPDLDRALEWYRDRFDFELESRWEVEEAGLRFAHLRAGGVRFELMERDGASPEPAEPWDPTEVPGTVVPGRVVPEPEEGASVKVRLDGPVAEIVPGEPPAQERRRVHILRDAQGRRIDVVEPREE